MQFPVRFSIVTYNLWGTERWPDRADALGLFLDLYAPDVFCVQELTRETRDFVDERLVNHDRVDDDTLAGWLTESNIWWRQDLFGLVEHGAETFGCTEYPDRRLFWVRLRPCDRSSSVVISTVHLTDFATAHEFETGNSPRVEEARQLVQALTRVVAEDEPALVVGDFNDSCGALAPLGLAGYFSCFGALHQIPPTTLPASYDRFGGGSFATAFVLDWVLANVHARAIAAASPHVHAGDISPSDHWPVHAVYQI